MANSSSAAGSRFEISHAVAEPPAPRRAQRSPTQEDVNKAIRPSSGFDGHAAALTINELMDSLERVKHIIESHSGAGAGAGTTVIVQASDPERLDLLRSARDELESIQAQIEAEATLSPEWRAKLVDLAAAYGSDLAVLLSTEAWDDVNRRRSRVVGGNSKMQHQQQQSPLQEALSNHNNSSRSSNGKAPVFKETTKTFALESLELFDSLLDKGYAVEILEPGQPGATPIAKGDKVSLEYIVYIWDSVNMLAVSYADSASSGNLEFVVGDDEQPVGLSLGLESLSEGARFNICISPPLAHGENGTTDVPPNTHVLYEGKVVGVERHAASVASETVELAETHPDALLKNKRASLRYPARQNRVSLAIPGEPIDSTDLQQPPPPTLQTPLISPAASSSYNSSSSTNTLTTCPSGDGDSNSAPGALPARTKSPFQQELSTAVTSKSNARANAELSNTKKHSSHEQQPPPLPPRSDYLFSKTGGPMKVPPRPTRNLAPTVSASSTASAPVPPVPHTRNHGMKPSTSDTPPQTVSSISSAPASRATQAGANAHNDIPTNGSPNLGKSVNEWLADVGFEQFAPAFHELGVEELADFGLLHKSDLERIGMRLIQVRKFMAHVANLGISIE